MSYSTLAGTRGLTNRVSTPIRQPAAYKKLLNPIVHSPIKCRCPSPVNGLGLDPTIGQLAKFLENYKDYVLAFSPATNSIAAYSRGMSKIAFTVKLKQNEPTDAGLSKARAIIDGKAGVDGLGNIFNDMGRNAQMVAALKAKPPSMAGSFNPNTAWGSRYKPAPWMGWRSGNGRRQSVPFYAYGMNGIGAVTPIVIDPPIDQQKISFDAPSLTIYMGPNKIALIPALISALAVKMILFGGSTMATATKFWNASDKAAKNLARA